MRGGGVDVFGSGTAQEVSRMGEDQDVELGRSSGILLHPTSLPGGRLGDEAYRFVDWLAEAGQSWWQMLPIGPPDEFGSPYRTTSAFAGSPALLADPAAPVSAAEIEDFVGREAVLERRVGALRGRGRARRPGAVRARVDGAARIRTRARRAADRRRPDLRLRHRRGHPGLAGAVRARRGRRRAARPAERERPALGQPVVRLARASRHRLSLVGRALPSHVRARRHGARRSLPRLRRVLGDPRRAQDGAQRSLAPLRPAPSCSPRSRAHSATCR